MLFLTIIGFVIAIYAFLFILVFQMAAVPTLRINSDLSEASGGEIISVFALPQALSGGKQHFVITLAQNVSSAEADRLACSVVPRILAQDGYPGTSFELARLGVTNLADSSTACP